MKRLALIFLLLFFGCATVPTALTTPQTACPPENVYIGIIVDGVVIPVRIKKGVLDDPKKFKNQKQFDEWLEKQRILRYDFDKKKGIGM